MRNRKIASILELFNSKLTGNEVKDLETRLESLVSGKPECLYEFKEHSCDAAREAIAAVSAKLYAKSNSKETLSSLLTGLSVDPNKWVRIKAQRALPAFELRADKMSPLGNDCMSLFYAKQKGVEGSMLRSLAHAIEASFRKKVMRRKKRRGAINLGQDMDAAITFFAAAHGLLSTDELHYDIDYSPGWKGDELYVANLYSTNPLRTSFAVWPCRSKRAFVAGVHERDSYDEFAIYTKYFDDSATAKLFIEGLDKKIDARYFKDSSWEEVVRWV